MTPHHAPAQTGVGSLASAGTRGAVAPWPAPADPAAALIERLNALMPWFLQGGSLAGALHYSEQDLEVFYTAGYEVFTQGRHAEALQVFGWLAALDPAQTRFHHAVATCLQRLGRHRDAAASYLLLKVMEPDNPEPLLRLAECLLATGDRAEAAGLLDEVIAATAPAGDPAIWRQRALALRQLLRRAETPTPTPTPTSPGALS